MSGASPAAVAARQRAADPNLVMYEVVFCSPRTQKMCVFGEQRKRFDTRQHAEVFVKMHINVEKGDRFLGIVKGTRADVEALCIPKQQLMAEFEEAVDYGDGKMAHQCEWKVGTYDPNDNSTYLELREPEEPWMFGSKEAAHACSRFLDQYCYPFLNANENFVLVQVSLDDEKPLKFLCQKHKVRD